MNDIMDLVEVAAKEHFDATLSKVDSLLSSENGFVLPPFEVDILLPYGRVSELVQRELECYLTKRKARKQVSSQCKKALFDAENNAKTFNKMLYSSIDVFGDSLNKI